MVLHVTVGVTLTEAGGGGGGGSLQTGVEEGLGSCHLASRTLESHSAGLTVLWGRHCYGHVRELLQEFH